MEFRITLDREAFKVLASDTRLDILKALDERPMTVSELGRKLDFNKATVFEHLEKLIGAGLVKKQDDEERKWVYYSLSWKARRILHPERVTIALLFSASLGALLSGIVVMGEYLRNAAPVPGVILRSPAGAPPNTGDGQGSSAGASNNAPSAAPALADDRVIAAAQQDPTLLYISIALFVTVVVLAGIAWWYLRRAQAREASQAATRA